MSNPGGWKTGDQCLRRLQSSKFRARVECKTKQSKTINLDMIILPHTHLLKRNYLRVYTRKTKAYPRKRKTDFNTEEQETEALG